MGIAIIMPVMPKYLEELTGAAVSEAATEPLDAQSQWRFGALRPLSTAELGAQLRGRDRCDLE